MLETAAACKERKERCRDEVVRGSACAVDVRPIFQCGIGRAKKVVSCLRGIIAFDNAFDFLRDPVNAGIVDQDMGASSLVSTS